MKLSLTAALPLIAAVIATPAVAGTENFTTNSGTVTSTVGGTSNGNSAKFTSSGGTDHVIMTAYQINQTTNAVNTAELGLYSPGVGDVGLGDQNGANGYHQIDNAYGYTDFVELVFDHAVSLTSIGITSFALGSNTTYDNDLSYQALTGSYSPGNALGAWTNFSNPGGSVPYGNPGVSVTDALNSSAVSRYWLVAAGVGQTNDGFKISTLKVTLPVPEPATWAMMLIGFGAIGLTMRKRSNAPLAQIA